MNHPISLDAARQELADAIAKFQTPIPAPLNVSPWVAMALLQKALRRGREQLALRAAATLLAISPERLWRRCGSIAFEDIGVADLETLSVVTAALAGKRFRATLGGEWPVASFIVSKMAVATKCRAADDLLMSVELHPSYSDWRRDLSLMGTPDLISIAMGPGPLPQRALAMWYALGTNPRQARHLRPRRGDPRVVFDALRAAGDPNGVVEIGHEAFRKIGEPLCPFVSLLWSLRQAETGFVRDDLFPPEVLIRGVPSWAYDTYTREGRAAYQVFLQGESETARWVRGHIGPSQRVSFLSGIVFRVEGQLCRNRLRWPVADELRRLVDYESQGPGCPDATEVLQLRRDEIPLLNEVRAHVC
jgi:hypothetical protein